MFFCDGEDGKERTNICLFDVGKTKSFSLLGDILRSKILKIYGWISREFKANDVLVYITHANDSIWLAIDEDGSPPEFTIT